MREIIVVCLLLLALAAPCTAQDSSFDPTGGPNSFHQLRSLSGLSGSGFGVDVKGYPSLSGPVAFTTPIAYVMGHNRFWLGGGQYSFGRRPGFDTFEGNWNAFLMAGASVGSFNVTATYNVVGDGWKTLYNFQVGWVPPKNFPVAFSIGVEDAFNRSIDGAVDEFGNVLADRTFFGVATYRLETRRNPVFLTLGIGTQRFNRPFGSASYQFARNYRGWMEFDHYSVNAGLVYATRLGSGKHALDFSALIGLARARNFLFGIGIGF